MYQSRQMLDDQRSLLQHNHPSIRHQHFSFMPLRPEKLTDAQLTRKFPDLKLYYSVYQGPPLRTTLSHKIPAYGPTIYFLTTHLPLTSHLCAGFSSDTSYEVLQPKCGMYFSFSSSHSRFTRPVINTNYLDLHCTILSFFTLLRLFETNTPNTEYFVN